MEQEVRSPTTFLALWTEVIMCSPQTLRRHKNTIHPYLVLSFRKVT